MMEAIVWDSLTVTYQLDIVGDVDSFMVCDEFDGGTL